MHRIAPNTIGNNLFLLALIGLEKRKLRLSGRLEKFMAAGLLVLFYQMKCAYETKIISYMIDTPSEPDPMTIEDLRQRKIKILLDDKSVNRSIVQSKYDIMISEDDYSKVYSLQRKYRYISLKENFFTDIMFYTFYKTHLFIKRFARFQRSTFEAGMKKHWRSIRSG
ncbi:uncharacterized protein LOC126574777 [Anopheles aquasalis]|uniref:uncharacterized protein LOC126574777 n=1 Tax=Anopheles aquasalis TaxID=42839 RepID=UPI00215A755B|nr:uncharacterized protein LOC126574777 [Anopheles aquasalis]